jgi:hypothetical protein
MAKNLSAEASAKADSLLTGLDKWGALQLPLKLRFKLITGRNLLVLILPPKLLLFSADGRESLWGPSCKDSQGEA